MSAFLQDRDTTEGEWAIVSEKFSFRAVRILKLKISKTITIRE